MSKFERSCWLWTKTKKEFVDKKNSKEVLVIDKRNKFFELKRDTWPKEKGGKKGRDTLFEPMKKDKI